MSDDEIILAQLSGTLLIKIKHENIDGALSYTVLEKASETQASIEPTTSHPPSSMSPVQVTVFLPGDPISPGRTCGRLCSSSFHH